MNPWTVEASILAVPRLGISPRLDPLSEDSHAALSVYHIITFTDYLTFKTATVLCM